MADVRIASFGTPLDAELARVYLESHDIECRLSDELLVGTALLYQHALGGVKLHVAAADAERASELLAEYETAQRPEKRAETNDERVRRALISAFVGFLPIVGIIHLYSLWLLAHSSYPDLSRRARREFWVALGLDILGVLCLVGVVIAAFDMYSLRSDEPLPIE